MQKTTTITRHDEATCAVLADALRAIDKAFSDGDLIWKRLCAAITLLNDENEDAETLVDERGEERR